MLPTSSSLSHRFRSGSHVRLPGSDAETVTPSMRHSIKARATQVSILFP